MVLESAIICFDNSDYQRNGDHFPKRLNVQKHGVSFVCKSKLRSNLENDVGLMTISNTVEVLATMTSDVGRIFSKKHLIQPKGDIDLLTGIRIADLVLKHRQGKNHKMGIVGVVGVAGIGQSWMFVPVRRPTCCWVTTKQRRMAKVMWTLLSLAITATKKF